MNLLQKFFPLPKYLNMSAVGIDISDRSIKYAELKKHDSGFRLKSFGSKKIEKNIVERGLIQGKKELTNCLKGLREVIGNKYAVVSLPEEKAFLKSVILPAVEKLMVRKSLEVQLEEIVPFSPEDVIFDFEIVENSFVPKGQMEVVLSAFPRKIAEDYAEVFENAGFLPLAFEIESQSVFRSLVTRGEKDPMMAIDFGKTRTSFFVGENRAVKFGSTIKVGGEHIDKALAKNLNLDVFEAERVKKRHIFQGKQNTQILNSVLPVVSVIKDEARRILDYWQLHAKEMVGVGASARPKVQKVLLCGGDSNMIGLADYLAYELKLRAEQGNPWINITSFDEYVPEIESNESLMYVTALGLTLRCFDYDKFIAC